MIRYFKALLEAIQKLAQEVEDAGVLLHRASEALGTDDGLRERVDALERSRATWEAEIEGALLRAENQFKAARSSEERARGMERRAQALAGADDGDEEGEDPISREWLDLVQSRDVDGGEEEGVQSMHEGVGRVPSGKELAKAAKWGRS